MKKLRCLRLPPEAPGRVLVWAVGLVLVVEVLPLGTTEIARGAEIKILSKSRVVPAGEDGSPGGEIRLAGGPLATLRPITTLGLGRQHLVFAPVSHCQVGILGAIPQPGVYLLRRDDCTLRALLKSAGGVLKAANGKLGLVRFLEGAESRRTKAPIVLRLDLYSRHRQAQLLQTRLIDGDVVMVEGMRDRAYVVNIPQWVAEVECRPRAGHRLGQLVSNQLPLDQPASQNASAWLIRQNSSVILLDLSRLENQGFENSTLRSGDLLYIGGYAGGISMRHPTINLVGIEALTDHGPIRLVSGRDRSE